jgi:hypothetical protein
LSIIHVHKQVTGNLAIKTATFGYPWESWFVCRVSWKIQVNGIEVEDVVRVCMISTNELFSKQHSLASLIWRCGASHVATFPPFL